MLGKRASSASSSAEKSMVTAAALVKAGCVKLMENRRLMRVKDFRDVLFENISQFKAAVVQHMARIDASVEGDADYFGSRSARFFCKQITCESLDFFWRILFYGDLVGERF